MRSGTHRSQRCRRLRNTVDSGRLVSAIEGVRVVFHTQDLEMGRKGPKVKVGQLDRETSAVKQRNALRRSKRVHIRTILQKGKENISPPSAQNCQRRARASEANKEAENVLALQDHGDLRNYVATSRMDRAKGGTNVRTNTLRLPILRRRRD